MADTLFIKVKMITVKEEPVDDRGDPNRTETDSETEGGMINNNAYSFLDLL
jgi:hypothetical protein